MAISTRLDEGGKPAQLTKSVVRELGETLEELRIAAEQLQLAADDIAVARQEATANADRYRELYEALPLACVMTNDEGCVTDANTLASRMLNVASPYLSGKPLFLFLPQRDAYFEMLDRVRTEGRVMAQAVLRPRDRKPINVTVTVTALKHQMRWCWVFGEIDGVVLGVPESRTPTDGVPLPSGPDLN